MIIVNPNPVKACTKYVLTVVTPVLNISVCLCFVVFSPELSKVEGLVKNEKMDVIYKSWNERLHDIKENQIPELTDMLIEAEYSLNKTNYFLCPVRG